MNDATLQKAEQHAKGCGYLIWSNPAKMLLFVTETGHDELKTWMKKSL